MNLVKLIRVYTLVVDFLILNNKYFMKKGFLILALGLVSSLGFSQNWAVDKNHSNLGFTITHLMISEVDGNFKDFDAKITSSKADFSDAVFELTANIASINTGNEMRDKHLRSGDYFDVEKFSTMSFKSTSVKKVSGENYKIMGNLTIHGVTKPVTLNATLKGPVEHQRSKKQMIGLKVTGTINRIDFGVGKEGATLSNDVEIKATGEFVKDWYFEWKDILKWANAHFFYAL